MNNSISRLKNHRSLTSLTIARPFFNLSQEARQKDLNTSQVIENTKSTFNHTKCTILIKHLEEMIKEKSQKCQALEKEKEKLAKKLDLTSKILTKEREDFRTFREDCLPNTYWKGKVSEMKSVYKKKIVNLNEEISGLEKRLKDFDRFVTNAKIKSEGLIKELELKEKQMHLLCEEKNDLAEKLDLCTILNCRLTDFIKQILSKNPSTTLNLQYMNLENYFMPILGRILELNPQIETVDLEGNLITDAGIDQLAQFFSTCSGNLHTLILDMNKISVKGAWTLIESSINRENNLSKSMKKIGLSYNRLDQNELFIKAFEEIKEIRVKYPIIKIKKKDFAISRGQQLNQMFHLLCDKMFDNKTVKQVTFLLDRTEVMMKPVEEIFNLMNKNKKILYEQFKESQTNLSKQESIKTRLARLSTTKVRFKGIDVQKELDITFIMAQRPTFTLSYIQKLIKNGLDLNTIDKNLDENFLMYAARTNNLSLCKLLISKQSGYDIKNSEGYNAFLIACRYDNYEIANYLLLSGYKADSSDNKGANAIHHAVKEGKLRKVKKLAELGVSINWIDNQKKTPLHYAAKQGDPLIGELLFKLGANLNSLDYKGRNPVALAEDKEKTFFAKALITLGGKSIRKVVVPEDLKYLPKKHYKKSLSGIMQFVDSTVERTKKLYKDLKKTGDMLDTAKCQLLNKSVS